MSNAVIRSLAAEVAAASAEPRYARLKSLWTRHNGLRKVEKIPVQVFLHRGYTETWKELIPPETLVSHDPLEREIELQLRQKLYRHHNIPDDHVLVPTIWLTPVRPANAEPLWGVALPHVEADDPKGAYAFEPIVRDESDLAKLRYPRFSWDRPATEALVERARELTGDILPVKVLTEDLRANPGERLVEFLGWEGFLFGLAENPRLVHALMDFLTEGFVRFHLDREAQGVLDAEESWWYRIQYEDLPDGTPTNRLTSSWVYITAQTTGGISPAMYAEFIQPYNERIARLFGEGRVYYHGCEDLSRKIDVIRALPNLRRFHVSPWTDLRVAVEKLGDTMVLETHVNPATTTLSLDEAQMRRELRAITEVAGDRIVDINLSDVQTVGGDHRILTRWAEIAQELAAR
jgi:hypothetical protein